MNRWLSSVPLAVLTASAAIAASVTTMPFDSSSYDAIRRSHADSAFLLVLWSVDCPPCVKELGVLAEALRKHPKLKLVMVSTDDTASRPKVDELLTKYGLQGVESWIFGDGNARRLRQQVDPSWFGELPRSYFYDAQHRRVPFSGGLTAHPLDAWLRTVDP